MRKLLLVATVLALFVLMVGGVSAHDGNQDDDRMNEMMDQCMEMMGQMGEMMNGTGSMNGGEHGDSTNTEMDSQNGEGHHDQSNSGGMGCC